MEFCKSNNYQGDWSTATLKSIRNDLDWHLLNYGNGVCNIGNTGGIDQCAQICKSIEGCKYFSVSEETRCFACFIYKTCNDPVTDPYTNYKIYEIQEGNFLNRIFIA